MCAQNPSGSKPLPEVIALVLAVLALVGSSFRIVARYISILDQPLVCFELPLTLLISGVSIILCIRGLRSTHRILAWIALLLNCLAIALFFSAGWAISDKSDKIEQIEPLSGDYDMAVNACQADWYYPSYNMTISGSRILCDSHLAQSNGLVLPLDSVRLSNGETVGPVIWIEKRNDTEFIGAIFPLYQVKEGDRFIARIGCAEDQALCDSNVIFHVWYETGLTTQKVIEGVAKVDQPPVDLEIDLSDLAGKTIYISLHVYPADESGSAVQVTLIAPRIVSP